MRAPKFYLVIDGGWWMAGKHGYQRKSDAVEFKERWQKTMALAGLDVDAAAKAIRVVKA